jgi:hypothetical protein
MALIRQLDLSGATLEQKLILARDLRLAPAGPGRLARLGVFLGGLSRRDPRPAPALADVLPWLFPKVLPGFEYEAYTLATGRPAPEHRPLAGPFAVSLVVDLPNQDLDVGAAELRAWNADFEGLLQTARQNLLARGGGPLLAAGPGRHHAVWRDGLGGGRLLLPGLLEGLALTGDPVALLPTRETLLVAGSEDPDSLRWALEGALHALDTDPRPLNACPLRLRNLRWEPFQVPEGHPAAGLLDQIERRRFRDERARRDSLQGRRPAVLPEQMEPVAVRG